MIGDDVDIVCLKVKGRIMGRGMEIGSGNCPVPVD
jgi:hypothetical protein